MIPPARPDLGPEEVAAVTEVLNSGITIVGKRARIPTSIRIGRNCIVGPGVREEDLATDYLASGSSISATGPIPGPP